MKAFVYASGLRLQAVEGRSRARESGNDGEGPARGGGLRGKVEGFSRASARRLRLAFLTLNRFEWHRISFTLTVHRPCTPDEWREIMDKFRFWIVRQEWSLIWRIELQRRQTPHLHGVWWAEHEEDLERFREGWLQATGETGDVEARKFAVAQTVMRGPGWLAYCAAHATKTTQLGWIGRQWGVWGRKYLDLEPVVETRLSTRGGVWLVRLLRRWRNCRVGICGFTRLMDGSLARRFVEAARVIAAEPRANPF